MQFPLCNKKPERAPHIYGHTFILCWRCTGLIIGACFGIIARLILGNFSQIYYLLLLPVAIDGGLQYIFRIMSNNPRRFITGFVGGLVTAIA